MIVPHALGSRAMVALTTAMRLALAALSFVATPGFLSALALLSGCGLLITGVHMLWGQGWALIAGSVPAFVVGGVLLRGVIHGE